MAAGLFDNLPAKGVGDKRKTAHRPEDILSESSEKQSETPEAPEAEKKEKEKTKRGRPRSKTLRTRLTCMPKTTTYNTIKQMAARHNMTMSDIIDELCEKYAAILEEGFRD